MAEETPRYYDYNPSEVAAIIFIVLYFLSTFWHIWQALRARSLFMIPFIIGGFFESIGYVGRAIGENRGAYIMQTILILLGPALFAASIYMILGRIIILTGAQQYSLIRLNWQTKIFVFGDVLSFLVQCGGGGIMASADADRDQLKLGQNVILVGLFIQIFFFGFFIFVSVFFQWRARGYLRTLAGKDNVGWRRHLYVLYTTSALILVRSLFRIIEYMMGEQGYLLQHEVFLYVFDAALMFLTMLVMNVAHPGEIATLLKEKGDRGRMIDLEEA